MNQNLVNVGQMCDQGHTILFNSTKCEIKKGRYGEIVATSSRAPNDIYVLDEATKGCLIAKEDDIIFGRNDDQLTSQPYVMQEFGQAARFQAAPKEAHIIAIKRTLRYLKGTIEYVLWYPKGNNLVIHANCAGSSDDRESTHEALKLGILPSSH